MYSVAGNHDLPHHRIDQIERSAYWTLVQAGRIHHLERGRWWPLTRGKGKDERTVWLHGFSWGEPVVIQGDMTRGPGTHVAVCHAYCWLEGHAFPGVKEEDHVDAYAMLLDGCPAVFGDNHKGFIHKNILNGGTFMRRRSDEADYRPFVGLLTDKGEWRRHYLDISQDKTIGKADKVVVEVDGQRYVEFLEMLESLGDTALDFEAAVKEAMTKFEAMTNFKVAGAVRDIVLRCMGARS